MPPIVLVSIVTALGVAVVVRAVGRPQATTAAVMLNAAIWGCAVFWFLAARGYGGWTIALTRVVWVIVIIEAAILFVAVRSRQEPPWQPPQSGPPSEQRDIRINRAAYAARARRRRYRFVE